MLQLKNTAAAVFPAALALVLLFSVPADVKAQDAWTASTGSLKVDTHPSGLEARWRRVGTTTWMADEAVESGLAPGTYWVEFEDKQGYEKPDQKQAQVEAGKTTTVHADYVATSGSLKVDTHHSSLEARWKIESIGVWYADGYTKQFLDPGTYTVIFEDKAGYITPDPVQASVTVGNTTVIDATYQEDNTKGSLKVYIEPEGVPGTWRRTGTSTWYQSGQTEAGIPPGDYTVEFGTLAGFTEPVDHQVTVTADNTAQIQATYGIASDKAALKVDTHHSGLKAKWRRKGTTTWLADEAVEGNLPPGDYWIQFEPKEGYQTPADKLAQCIAGKLTVVDVTYQLDTTYGWLKVDTRSSTLKARWRIAGQSVWRADEEKVKLDPGSYTVQFEAKDGYRTPADRTVQVEGGKVTELVVYYEKGSNDPTKGSLKVDTRSSTLHARWKLAEGNEWHADEETIDLNPGTYTVQFEKKDGYITPSSRQVNIQQGTLTELVVYYEKGEDDPSKGRLKVDTRSSTLKAEWRIAGTSQWYLDEQTISLDPGTYTVDFEKVEGYRTPASRTVTVNKGELTEIIVFYEKGEEESFGSLEVIITPGAARGDGAAFAVIVDGHKSWHPGGSIVEQLKPGTYQVGFNSLNGWVAPDGRTVTVESGQRTTITVEYKSGAPKPVIRSFYAEHKNISAGDSTMLHWNVSGADSISIEGVGDNLAPQGSAEVFPNHDTIYTLTGENEGGKVTAQTSIFVAAGAPQIVYANSDSTEQTPTTPNRPATIRFGVKSAVRVMLVDKRTGQVVREWDRVRNGEAYVQTPISSTYEIRALSGQGVSSRDVDVAVSNLPVIADFAVNKNFIFGDTAKIVFNWDVRGAETCSITPDVGEVHSSEDGSGQTSMRIDKPGIYTLTATNAFGTVTRTVEIKQLPDKRRAADLALTVTGMRSDSRPFGPLGAGNGALEMRMGEGAEISIRVTNEGRRAASDIIVSLNGKNAIEKQINIGRLKPGQSIDTTISVLPLKAGSFTARLVIDPDHMIPERNLGNNKATVKVAVEKVKGTDPLITDVQIAPVETDNDERWIRVDYTIFNAGKKRVKDLQARITIDGATVADEYVGNLRYGEMIRQTGYFRIYDDTFRLGIDLDPNDALTELHEKNNTYRKKFTWESLVQ